MKKSTDKHILELKELLEKEIVHQRPALLPMQDDLGASGSLSHSQLHTTPQAIESNFDPKANQLNTN
ncbi:MAG: hypothetical protein K9J38_11605 [Polynucleobacter sp.]|jgi:hypothetical protein|nr:hypothetical protein [Polynucleobacter sp.]